MYKGNRVYAIIPALNEEKAIAKVVSDLLSLKQGSESNEAGRPVIDRVIVCDNGSSDNTTDQARNAGAYVCQQKKAGYGIACLTAISEIDDCDIVLFIDGDDCCFVEQALPLLEGIVAGDDLAIGSRTMGEMELGALTSTQQFGNQFAAFLINLLWAYKISDLGPFRAIRHDALLQLNMQDESFGWTVEMQVKAIMQGLTMNEYPVDSKVRIGQSKISGTLKGSLKAGVGILSMIAKLRLSGNSKQESNNVSH